MSSRTRYYLSRPILALLLVLGSSLAQDNTTSTNISATPISTTSIASTSLDCTVEEAEYCIEIGNRSCYEGDCTGCIEGFVSLPEEVLDLTDDDNYTTIIHTLNMTKAGTSNGTICAPIEALNTALYERVYKPLWNEVLTSEQRLDILFGVARKISQENARNGPNASYTLALNEFSADTPEEARQLAGYRVPSDSRLIVEEMIQAELDKIDEEYTDFPARVDWVELGAVTSVKNQGRCGCCWSISTCGALEGAAAIWSNFTYLQSLSFQQLISCDKTNNGCNGGFPAAAIRYANDNLFGGTVRLNDYPFTDEEGDATTTCALEDQEVAVNSALGRTLVYYGTVGDTTYGIRMQKMKQGLSRQPVAVAVKSLCPTFKNYHSGVVTDDGECACQPSSPEPCLDHAVLLVGYDDDPEDGSPPFWKIKNSWGTGWGEEGYIRIAQANPIRDEDSWGLFGVLAEGVVPLQALNQTEEVYDKPQTIGELEVWEFSLIIVAIVVVCIGVAVGVLAYVKGWCQKE